MLDSKPKYYKVKVAKKGRIKCSVYTKSDTSSILKSAHNRDRLEAAISEHLVLHADFFPQRYFILYIIPLHFTFSEA